MTDPGWIRHFSYIFFLKSKNLKKNEGIRHFRIFFISNLIYSKNEVTDPAWIRHFGYVLFKHFFLSWSDGSVTSAKWRILTESVTSAK